MKGTLKLEPTSGHSYNKLYQTLQTNPLFDQSAWEQSAREGNLLNYSDLLSNTNKIADINKFKDTYHYDFADTTSKILALQNEIYPDYTIQKRTRYKQDEQGNYLRDKDTGEYLTEEYEISNYDYLKNAILENSLQREQEFRLNQEREAKNTMNWVEKAGASILGLAGQLASSAVVSFENDAKFAAGLFYAGYRALNGQEGFSDALVNFYNATIGEKIENLPGKDLQDFVTDFESKYSYIRDVDGQYTNVGKYLGGMADSLGQMVPSMIIPSFGTGRFAKLSRNVVGTGLFYSGVTAEDIKTNYNYLKQFGCDVNTWQIITNSTVKSGLQAIEEVALGEMFGTSTVDRIVKGQGKVKLFSGKNIYGSALNRLLSEAWEEGLEEVVQDTSNFLVDKAFQYLINADFGLLTKNDGSSAITWESLTDSFIMGALTSIAGSSFQVLTTKRNTVPKVDKDGKVVRDADGNIVYKKLSKLSSWEYGLDLQTFMENYKKVIDLGEKNNYYAGDSKVANEYNKAFKTMYASYRILSSLYGEIGTERFETANKLLKSITEYTKMGMFNTQFLTDEANDIANEISSLPTLYTREEIINKLKEASLANKLDVIDRDNIDNIKIDENIKNKFKKVFESDKNIKRIVTTKNGTSMMTFSDVVIVPINMMEKIDWKTVINTKAEQDLVNYVVKGNYPGFDLTMIRDIYRYYSDDKNGSTELAIYNLIYNKPFLNLVLFTNNKPVLQFVTSLKQIIETKPYNKYLNDIDNIQYHNHLNEALYNMNETIYNYCLASPDADIFVDVLTPEQIKKIELSKITTDIYKKIEENQWTTMTNNEKNIIEAQINSAPINAEKKNEIRKQLASTDILQRRQAVETLYKLYHNIVQLKYNGKIYMMPICPANRKFNAFLQSYNITLENMLDTEYYYKQEGKRLSDTELLSLRKDQFLTFTNGRLRFEQARGKIQVYSGDSVVSMDVVRSNKPNDFVTTRTSKSNHNLILDSLNKNIDDRTRAYITLDDVIQNHDLLSEDVIRKILGDEVTDSEPVNGTMVSDEEVFNYLQKEVNAVSHGQRCIVLTSDGEFVYGNNNQMEDVLKDNFPSDLKTTDVYKISDFVNSNYLVPRTENIAVVFDDKMNKNEYGLYLPPNIIKINANIINNADMLKTTILHEFQHVLQVQQGMTTGFSGTYLQDLRDKFLNKDGTVKKDGYKLKQLYDNIIKDLKKHVPYIFKDSKVADDAINADHFLYNASYGERMAANDIEITFYPIVSDGKTLTMPWGTKYNLIKNEVKNGFNITSLEQYAIKSYTDSVYNMTEDYSIDDFVNKPTSIFVMPDGTIRKVKDGSNHYKIINTVTQNLTSKTAINYFNTLPEVSVQISPNYELYVAIRVGDGMSTEAMQSLTKVINTLYDFDTDFELGAIYESKNSTVVKSDIADNADDLMLKYNMLNRLRNSTSMSMSSYSESDMTSGTEIKETTAEQDERKLKRKITNKTGQGKWISKKAIVDKEGHIVRDKAGNIRYNYKYKTDRKITQTEGKGTNLEKYGYTKPYKVTQINNNTKSFIVNATPDIDEKLWNKVIKGKLTQQSVFDYLRDSDTIDDKTFKLINDSYFKNSDIKTFEELENYVQHSNEYYALRIIARKLGYSEKLTNITDPNFIQKFIEAISTDQTLSKLYTRLKDNYSTFKNEDIVISNKYLRKLWMEKFDGSVDAAGAIALIAKEAAIKKWIVTGEGSSLARRSLQEQTGDDITLGDAIAKTEMNSTQSAYSYIDYGVDRDEKVDAIMQVFSPDYARQLMAEGKGPNFIMTALKEKREQLSKMSNKQFAVEYEKIINGKSEAEINKMFNIAVSAEASGLDATKLSDKQMDKFAKLTEESSEAFRPSSAIVNNLNSLVRTIKSHLSPTDKKRFLEQNSDIFTSKLKLKDSSYKTENGYKDAKVLVELENRVRQLSKDAKQGLYQSKAAMQYKKVYENKIKQVNEMIKKLKSGATVGTVPSVTVEVDTNVITLSTNKEMPTIIKDILKKQFKDTAPSLTQFVTEKDATHMKMSVSEFINNNANYLYNLNQDQVNQIVDYFENTFPLLGSENERQYIATQICLSTFLLKANKNKSYSWSLNDEQVKVLESKIASTVSESAAVLPIWRDAMKDLQPEKIIASSFARQTGIEYEGMEADIDKIISANNTGDINKIIEARQLMYENAIKNYKGRKRTIMDKLIDFQRLMMLSGPGTWLRNLSSNTIMTGTDAVSERLGKATTSLLTKLFPKLKRREGQYQIIGTKVTSDVKTFIKNQIIDNGLLTLIKDGFNKYDFRKTKNQGIEVTITDLIVNSIQSEIFQNTQYKYKGTQAFQKMLLKAMSDDKFINKRAITYLGKILTETNTDLSKGITTDVMNKLADAYTLAASEFMHKHNFINDLETKLKEKSPTAYFVWKQVAPFAASSWNWFVEGLKYTPVGLIKSIVNFAKLEKSIENIDLKRQKGEMTYSSKFAQYIATKNIGKGIIGSIGMVIGIALVAAGKAGIDEEDDKYKLRVGNIKVDISDVFGTQGIMMGIATASSIVEQNQSLMDVFANTLDIMFEDSLYTTFWDVFRYSQGFSDFALYLPNNMLQMMIPNFLKNLSGAVSKYKVKFSPGILGKIEKVANQAVPFLSYAMPHYVDPYTGEEQVIYKAWWLTNLVNKFTPVKIYPYNVSDTEKLAIELGVNKSMLNGEYTINGEDIKLTGSQTEELNKFYGKLNKDSLNTLMKTNKKYKVQKEDGTFTELPYSKMSDKQKAAVINRIMNDNSSKSKIYILTKSNKYTYYASDSEYQELKKLGINVKKEVGNKKGLVKN